MCADDLIIVHKVVAFNRGSVLCRVQNRTSNAMQTRVTTQLLDIYYYIWGEAFMEPFVGSH